MAWHSPFLSPLEEPRQGGGTVRLAPSHPSFRPCRGQPQPCTQVSAGPAALRQTQPGAGPQLSAALAGGCRRAGQQSPKVSPGGGSPHSAESELQAGREQAGRTPCDSHARCWGSVLGHAGPRMGVIRPDRKRSRRSPSLLVNKPVSAKCCKQPARPMSLE